MTATNIYAMALVASYLLVYLQIQYVRRSGCCYGCNDCPLM